MQAHEDIIGVSINASVVDFVSAKLLSPARQMHDRNG